MKKKWIKIKIEIRAFITWIDRSEIDDNVDN